MDFAGNRITVMGLGRFGGGIGVTRYLAGKGADVLVTDLDSADRLKESIAAIQGLVDAGAVKLRLGEHNVSDFTTCDMVVANPGVPRPWENRFLRAAQAAGVPVTTEIRLLTERLARTSRVIGVTGTAGKSTTSAMIAHMLGKLGQKVLFGGNIGGSLLDCAIDAGTWVVLELSSFQLHWLGDGVGSPHSRGWSPRYAVITNIKPNHLDWHGSLEHYRESKFNVCRYHDDAQRCATISVLESDAAAITPLRFSGTKPYSVPAEAEDQHIDPFLRLATPGVHNRLNARLAVWALSVAWRGEMIDEGSRPKSFDEHLEQEAAFKGRAARLLEDFAGLPHRLCHVATDGGVRYYDDSKSTTPESTLLALEAFGEQVGRVHLIAGGYDKGSDLSPIAHAAKSLAGLYTLGKTGPALASLAAGAEGVFDCKNLERAIELARQRARDGDIILLSPGCASWDQYVNYEARGRHFGDLVRGAVAGRRP